MRGRDWRCAFSHPATHYALSRWCYPKKLTQIRYSKTPARYATNGDQCEKSPICSDTELSHESHSTRCGDATEPSSISNRSSVAHRRQPLSVKQQQQHVRLWQSVTLASKRDAIHALRADARQTAADGQRRLPLYPVYLPQHPGRSYPGRQLSLRQKRQVKYAADGSAAGWPEYSGSAEHARGKNQRRLRQRFTATTRPDIHTGNRQPAFAGQELQRAI